MKPKHLKAPFRWGDRQPLFSEKVFYVPEHYQDHRASALPPWKEIFGNENPIYIEFCSGNGTWIAEKAEQEPHYNWIAVEMEFERVRKIWSKMHNFTLSNLLPLCGEAWTFAHHYLPDNCIEGAYINFPDPWPKNKHAKHRLIQEPFVKELSRIIKPKGQLVLATDEPRYCQQMIEKILQDAAWSSLIPSPYYKTSWPGYGTSYFDSLWRGQGCTIHYLQFGKNE